jgi:hypothetical protein
LRRQVRRSGLTDIDTTTRGLFSRSISLLFHTPAALHYAIIAALDAGRSVADAFQPLDNFSSAWMSGLRAGDGPPQEFPLEMWKREAAADAQRWRRRYADEEIPRLLKQSIRLEPFTISRP